MRTEAATQRTLARSCCGFLIVVLCGCAPEKAPEEHILFGQKRFNVFPWEPGREAVFASGTLTGDGVGYRNNTYSIYCEQETMRCSINEVVQVGPNQVGDLMVPLIYEVTKWNEDIVVAVSQDLAQCHRETISVMKGLEAVVWVREPINQSDGNCINADRIIYKWTLEDSPGWKAIKEAAARR